MLKSIFAAVSALTVACSPGLADTVLTDVQVFAAGVRFPNGQALSWVDANNGRPILVLQNDNNWVFYGTNASGANYAVITQFQHQNNAPFMIHTPLTLLQGGTGDVSGFGVTPLSGTSNVLLNLALKSLGLTPQMFGAKGDGSTDDTTALQAWLNTINAGAGAFCPAGEYIFTSKLTGLSNTSHVRIEGQQCTLDYRGSNTATDLVVLGTSNTSGGCSITDMNLSGVNIKSDTTMTSGDGLQLNDLCASQVDVAAGQDLNRTGGLWNGIHFNGGNSVHCRGHGSAGQNDAMIVNGDANGTQFTDFIFDNGNLLGSAVGLHVAGGVAMSATQGDWLENHINLKIDQSISAHANQQIFLGSGVTIDVTNGGNNRGIEVDDPGSNNSFLFLEGTWVASAAAECIYMTDQIQWSFNMTGGNIGNCKSDGYHQGTGANSVSNLVGTYVWGNQGAGLSNNGPSPLNKCGINFGVGPKANVRNTNGTIGSSC